VLPISDGLPARRFPIVTGALIAANIAVFPAWVYLGGWFLYQLLEAHSALVTPSADGGSVALFAHIGGFVFGWVVARACSTPSGSDPSSYRNAPRSGRSEQAEGVAVLQYSSMPSSPGERSSSPLRSAVWVRMAALVALALVAGRLAADVASEQWLGMLAAFAAGAVLASLADSVMPESYAEGGPLVADELTTLD
jgi:hypothetical protein